MPFGLRCVLSAHHFIPISPLRGWATRPAQIPTDRPRCVLLRCKRQIIGACLFQLKATLYIYLAFAATSHRTNNENVTHTYPRRRKNAATYIFKCKPKLDGCLLRFPPSRPFRALHRVLMMEQTNRQQQATGGASFSNWHPQHIPQNVIARSTKGVEGEHTHTHEHTHKKNTGNLL